MWLIGGDTGTSQSDEVWNSIDGINWNLVASGKFPARAWFGSLVFSDKIWVIGGWPGSGQRDVWYSD